MKQATEGNLQSGRGDGWECDSDAFFWCTGSNGAACGGCGCDIGDRRLKKD